MGRRDIYILVLGSIFLWGVLGFILPIASAAPYKVLVVMSYEKEYPWCGEIREGIDSVLAETSEITYFYMNTKTDLEGGPQKAKEAYALYQELQPDGLITADDNAQAMFVVPYLRDKVEKPVMFCGVNAAPEQYGYPASNVSGILERAHINESIILTQQLVPFSKTIGYILKDTPTAQGVIDQIERESPAYSAESLEIKLPKTMKEAVDMVKELKEHADILYMSNLQGLPDDNGMPLQEKEIIPVLVKIFGKPTIGDDAYRVRYGALCAVVKSGQEQGAKAAEMLLHAMQGTPVSEIPITQNKFGRRLININTMKSLNIKPKAAVIRGAELVNVEK